MKKISYYLIFVVIVGLALVSFWTYQRYFQEEDSNFLLFEVERGSIQEVVKVRGEVVAQKEFDLEFPFIGIIQSVFVKEGQIVNRGNPLMKLETRDLELDIQRLEAILAQREANLSKLLAGATTEDLQISKTKVANAKIALEDAKIDLINKLQDAYTKSDDAVRNKVDQFFNDPRGLSPQITFFVIDTQLEIDTEWARLLVEDTLTSWKLLLDQLTIESDINSYIKISKENLNLIKSLLDKSGLAVNGASSGPSLSQTTIDTWRVDVSTARTNVNTAITNVSVAEEKLRTSESNQRLAEDELVLKESGTRTEDIEIAKAEVQEIKNQIAVIIEEKIKRSTLYAPSSVKIVKIWFEKQEVFRPGQTAISLSTIGHKIQADISELEIGKIKVGDNEADGNEVLIQLDAFPSQEFKGRVFFIEPREVLKENDRYYRVNMSLDNELESQVIRSGMSADLIINISSKDNILKIPAFTISQKNNKKFVQVLKDGLQKVDSVDSLQEVEIETGISDGDFVEIVAGLSAGQVVVVSAD